MPRVPSRPNHLTPLGEIIWNAMERRTAERGAFYTYTDLAREMEETTGRRRSAPYIRNVVIGDRPNPEPQVLADIARALRPHVDYDQLLLATGQTPAGWAERVRDITAPRAGRTVEDALADLDEFNRVFLALRARLERLARAHVSRPRAPVRPRSGRRSSPPPPRTP